VGTVAPVTRTDALLAALTDVLESRREYLNAERELRRVTLSVFFAKHTGRIREIVIEPQAGQVISDNGEG
jgi:hypothetical protein